MDEGAPSPPPLPTSRAPEGRRRTWLIIAACGAVAAVALVLFAVAVVRFSSDFTPTDDQKACAVTARDAADLFGFEADGSAETWTGQQFFDGSRYVYYHYSEDDGDRGPVMITCSLTVDANRADAILSYGLEWESTVVSDRLSGSEIKLERADDLFRWGDQSKFAFQLTDDERHGFLFAGRKGARVFFLDCWGVVSEDPSEIEELLTPHLERFESTGF